MCYINISLHIPSTHSIYIYIVITVYMCMHFYIILLIIYIMYKVFIIQIDMSML